MGGMTVPDIQATYIEVSAEVRYWEDTRITGTAGLERDRYEYEN